MDPDTQYLVGADGARSTVRERIGARMIGTYGVSRNYNIIFRAPGLDKAQAHGSRIMGVGDSVDLGWKIAAVLDGWGGPALLDSYEQERKQTHEIVLDAAEANHSILAN